MPIQWNTHLDPWHRLADYYHGAPTTERDRIQSWGLQPGNPQLNGRWLLEDAGFTPEQAMMQNHHRTTNPGVFMTGEPEAAYTNGGQNDVWRIDPSYLQEDELGMDPLWQNARVSPHEVPPEALSLHTPAEDAIWGQRQGAAPDADWRGFDTSELYHAAPTTERARIMQHGLQMSNPGNSDQWDFARDGVDPQRDGVYMAINPEDTHINGAEDIWKIDPSYVHDMQPDHEWWEPSWQATHAIPPEALALHRPWEDEWGWKYAPNAKRADAMTTFNPMAPIDELTNFLGQQGGSAMGLLNPNNPLSEDADPNANTANPNMNPSNPDAFANPANPALNPNLPGAQTNPANPQFNPSVPGAQNNPSNPQYNPAVPGSTNNSANPELNPNYPGSMTNPSNPIHNPDWPNPEGVPQHPVQARTWAPVRMWEPKQSWVFEPEVGGDVPEEGDAVGGSVVAEMDNLSVHLEDGGALALDQAQALRAACLRLASALEPAADTWSMPKHAWNPFQYTPVPAVSPQEAAQGQACRFHPERPAVAAEGFAPMCAECYERYLQAQEGRQPVLAADIPGAEMGDSHNWPDPTEPRSADPPAPPLCTCAEGQKLECPVHGLHATDPENDDLWGRWHIPEANPVGYPQGQPRGWATPYQS